MDDLWNELDKNYSEIRHVECQRDLALTPLESLDVILLSGWFYRVRFTAYPQLFHIKDLSSVITATPTHYSTTAAYLSLLRKVMTGTGLSISLPMVQLGR